ncbi:hypothetical protein TNCV_3460191 [Trichonephila clavipes]|nr:hypothetical protein TNCV_3460191 [Trichonephila clavipes]
MQDKNNSTRHRNETTHFVSRNETTQLCTAVDRLQPPSTACNRLQPPTTVYNRLQPPTAACTAYPPAQQPPATAYNRLQPPTTACNRLQPPTTACNRLQPPAPPAPPAPPLQQNRLINLVDVEAEIAFAGNGRIVVCAFFFTTSAKEGVVGCFCFPCAQPLALARHFRRFGLVCFVLMGFLGHPEKFAGCGPLQLAHLAGALADFVQSEVRWPPEHFRHFGALAQNREW